MPDHPQDRTIVEQVEAFATAALHDLEKLGHRRRPDPTATTQPSQETAVIAVINESTVLSDEEVQSYVAAYQIQVDRDFAPRWGMATTLQFIPKAQAPPAAAWQMVFLDNTDQAGALGYHDLTAQGKPLAKMFAATCATYGVQVSVDGSHELMEMLGDPGINLTATAYDTNGNLSGLYAYEACDACEADTYGYEIDGVLVSDFVYPAWFGGIAATYFDHMHKITAPLELLPGGYIGLWTPSGGWTQQLGADRAADYSAVPTAGSRRERRARGRKNWLLSTPLTEA